MQGKFCVRSVAATGGPFGGPGQVDALLGRGTEIAIGAEGALESRFRFEFSSGNFHSPFFHLGPSFLQLQIRARGRNRTVVFQVVKNEAIGVISPLVVRGEGVDRKLQALVRIFLRTWFAGLVINNSNMLTSDTIQAIHTTNYRC